MTVPAYITAWSVIGGVVTASGFLGLLWTLFKNRGRIWKGTKWASCRGFGLFALFVGWIVLGSVALAVWEFPRFLIFVSTESLVGSFIGAGIGASAFAGVGMYAVLGGIWMTFPNTRPGRYVKRRFFGRPVHEKEREVDSWIALKKRIPVAGILWLLFRAML